MIHFFIALNTRGQTRISKFYVAQTEEQKLQVKQQVQEIVLERSSQTNMPSVCQYGTGKLIYRRFQQLFFCLCIDENDNELAYFEAIHLFVTVLNTYFNPVTELEIMYNFHKVYIILDEIFLAGEIMETNQYVILQQLQRIEG